MKRYLLRLPITMEKEVPPSKKKKSDRLKKSNIDETIEEEIEEPNLEIHKEVLSPFDTVIAEIKQRSSQLLADDNYDQYKGKIYSLRMKWNESHQPLTSSWRRNTREEEVLSVNWTV